MRTKVLLGAAVVLMLAVSVATIGSNMGFKISIPLTGNYAINLVSLPYYNSYTDSASLWSDLVASGITPYQISYYDSQNGAWVDYFGRGPFTLPASGGLLIKVTDASPLPWIVVGSHNPAFAFPLTGNYAINLVSIPYHTTAVTSQDIWNQLVAAGDTPYQISMYDSANGAWVDFFGRGPFTLVPGQALLIKVTDGSPTAWTPSHY